MTTQTLADSAHAHPALPQLAAIEGGLTAESVPTDHSVIASVVESHNLVGATLWSERRLTGTALPTIHQKPQTSSPKPASRPILVIDDHPDIRDLLDQALSDEGYRVVTCADATVAVEQIVTGKPGLVLLDLMMPRMTGWQIMGALRERSDCTDVKVVLISASRELYSTAQELGVECLAKPFSLNDLLNMVERLAGPPPQSQLSA